MRECADGEQTPCGAVEACPLGHKAPTGDASVSEAMFSIMDPELMAHVCGWAGVRAMLRHTAAPEAKAGAGLAFTGCS